MEKPLNRSKELNSLVFVLMMAGYYLKWYILNHIAIVLVLCSAYYLFKAVKAGREEGNTLGKCILPAIVIVMWICIYVIDMNLLYNFF